MKLWQKIAVICSAILIFTMSICCFILLIHTKNTILSITYEQAADKQWRLQSSFVEMSDYYATQGDSQAVKRSLVHYCFSRFADSSSVLVIDGTTIYSDTDIHPEQYLSIDAEDSKKQFIGMINDKEYLIIGDNCRLSALPNSSCYIFVVEDITDVHESIGRMTWQFLLLVILCTVFGLMLIIILVRRSMQPLTKLQIAANNIANGNYHQRANIQSSDEIGALASNFNKMAESVQKHIAELSETTRRQQLFIGGVTHEFKTPLTAILLNADTLQNTYMSEEEQIKSLNHIEKQGKWLERLVQKMLKLLTMDQDVAQRQISVPDLFDKVKESTLEMLFSRGISLDMQCDLYYINGDSDLLQSALVNLIDNASKASSPGQIVFLRAFDSILEVSDNGIGIPEDSLSRITDAFYMVDKSRSKRQGGVGLGLALVKEIAKAHGATLEIESKLGSGTTVRIRFPQ